MNKLRNLSAAALVATGVAATVAAVDDQARSRPPAQLKPAASTAQATSTAVAHSREFFHFDTVEEMTATSSAVLEGQVIRVEPGRSTGDGHARDTYINVTVQVDEVLAGESAETITIEELLLTDSESRRILLDGVEYSEPGDRGLYFVRAKPEGTYTLISSQGRYLDTNDGRLKGANENDELVKKVTKLEKQQLNDQIKAANEAAKQGKIKPLPYPAGLEKVR